MCSDLGERNTTALIIIFWHKRSNLFCQSVNDAEKKFSNQKLLELDMWVDFVFIENNFLVQTL